MIMGYGYLGLVDSGADVSLIRFDKNKPCLFTHMKPSSMNVSHEGGGQLKVLGEVNLSVSYGEEVHSLKFLVTENSLSELVFGIDAMKTLGLEVTRRQRAVESCEVEEWNILTKLSVKQDLDLKGALNKFLVSTGGFLGRTNILEHQIELVEGAKPFVERPHRFSHAVEVKMIEELERMIQKDVIEPSKSCCASAVVPVTKPDGSIRLCLDSRKLNAITVRDQFPQPNAQRIFARIQNKCKYFSVIDLKEAFWQIPLSEKKVEKAFASSRELTAFVVPGKGLYHFKVMPFGLSNSSASQCRLMFMILGHDLEPKVFVYVDDILVLAATVEEMISLLSEVATRLRKANLSINVKKSKFFAPEIKYLGYILSTEGVKADPGKVKCIIEFPTPQNVTELRRFLGLCGYYRRLVKNFSEIANALTELTKKNAFKWTKGAQRAFEELKVTMTTAPVLANPDFELEFTIQTDASDLGGAAILSQKIEGNERVIEYFSTKWDDHEVKYSATEKEALAVLKAIEHFRGYVFGTSFTVITDAAALTHIKTMRVEGQRRLSRWALSLSEHDMKIKHRSGRLSVAPDALSRTWRVESIVSEDDPWFKDLFEKVQRKEPEVKEYKYEDGCLWRYCISMNEMGIPGFIWKKIVPEKGRKDLIWEEHERLKHSGYKKCMTSLSRWYWWPRMAAMVKRMLKECQTCKKVKSPNRKTLVPMGRKPIPSYPFQWLSIDHFGPLPRSTKGNTVIFVVIDNFSKFILMKAMKSAQSQGVVDYLEREVFLKYGVPECLTSDNAKAFIGRKLVQLMNKYGIIHWTNAYYHPQSNVVERYMKTIGTACRLQVLSQGGNQKKWDEKLEETQMAMNSTVNESTGKSPFFVVYGHEYVPTGSRFAQLYDENTRVQRKRDEIEESFEEMRAQVKNQLIAAEKRNRERYDLRARPQKFSIGETVWALNKKLSDASEGYSSKLDVKYLEGKVENVVGQDVYWVKLETGAKKKLHANDLLKN